MSGIVDRTYAHGQKCDVVWAGMGGVHDNIHIPNCGLWFMIGYYWVGFGMIGSFICQHDVWVLLTSYDHMPCFKMPMQRFPTSQPKL